jgi:hypothetical protein
MELSPREVEGWQARTPAVPVLGPAIDLLTTRLLLVDAAEG